MEAYPFSSVVIQISSPVVFEVTEKMIPWRGDFCSSSASCDSLNFTITEGHDWEEPFSVEFEDQPARGRICIEKTDRETGEPLRGTVFEVRAKEDIAAPDGTVFIEA